MAEIHETRVNESKIDTILTEDITFTGEGDLSREIMIKGRYSGKIRSTSDIYIAEEAVVEADIVADSAYIWGHVTGNIQARTRVELQGNAVVNGDITAPKIIMGTDCQFDGKSNMKPEKKG